MSKRLLLVDDFAPVRLLLAVWLEDAGYEVVGVGSKAAARAQPGPFDALILDRRLPNGDGRDLIEDFRGVPTLVISGAEESCDLRKPFSVADLLAAVEGLWS